MLHLDIMDGHFVPNISFGPEVVRMATKCLRMPRHVHLMLSRPDLHLKAFKDAGSDTLLIHVEASCDIIRTLREIRALGMMPGLAINPETPFEALLPYLEESDEVLCMTVHPGFGGQQFMPEVLPKIEALRRHVQAHMDPDRFFSISVDGGVDLETIVKVADAGANLIVAGSSLYKSKTMNADLTALRTKAERALQRWL